jgi:serine/threonine protein kinase/tetratricopeptide (TPR) repeat protein
MATVYLARDLKHERKVALKVLKPELAAVMGPERFLGEIRTTANLQHPHLLPLHDSGEADGFLYYVMPYVEGETLRDRLDREKQLPVGEAVTIATEVADALQAAHEEGVIHRDIKPGNILLCRGHAVIADFGIALAVRAAGGSRLTETGLSLGTPHYMSPEQAAGESHVDARSDIYSLATVLYEMLAGEPPYTGGTTQVILTKRLTEPVPSVRRIRENVPVPIDATIQRALAPVAADRFATTGDFTAALSTPSMIEPREAARWRLWAVAGVVAALATATAIGLGRRGDVATAEPIDPNSIVVLPFVNMSSDPEQEFMSDGIAEELLNLLAQVPELRVISRTTAFSFKGRDDLTVPEIAAELGVAHVLQGSVRKAGNTIRISAQLIDPQSDAHLFSETYDRALDDIFAVQEEIASEVVAGLRVTLLGELPQIRETDPEAYSLFLQARHIGNMGSTRENTERVLSMYARALEIDPEYAPAYVDLAAWYAEQALRGWRPPEEGFKMAVQAAERAILLDPDYAYARAMLGGVMVAQGDVAGGATHVERALELDPANPEVLLIAGLVLESLGRFDEAILAFEYVADRDPVLLFNQEQLAGAYFAVSRWEDAAATSRTILQLNPEAGTLVLSLSLLEMGELEEALATAESMANPLVRLLGVAIASHALGRQSDFESALQELQEEWGEDAPEAVASVYVHTGDVDDAFVWLDRVTLGSAEATELIFWPKFAALRDDPRWTAFRERMGQSEEQLAAIPFDVRLPR